MISNGEDIAIASLLCVIDLDMIAVREAYFESRSDWDSKIDRIKQFPRDRLVEGASNGALYDLHRRCTLLRNYIGDCEANMVSLIETLSQLGAAAPRRPIVEIFANQISRIQQYSQCLEREMRDYLQLDSDRMMLLESRTSIRLSDCQIKEGKQG